MPGFQNGATGNVHRSHVRILFGILGWIMYKRSIVPPIIATNETFEQIYAKTLAGFETENNYKYNDLFPEPNNFDMIQHCKAIFDTTINQLTEN